MNLTKIEIAGFGNFAHSVSLDFSKGSMGLILGKNEAGKSTIVAAIFAAFFGLKTSEKKRWKSWEGNHQFEVGLCFENEGKTFRLKRDLEKNFVTIKELGVRERIIFNDYHLPTEKYEPAYREAFREIFDLPDKKILSTTAIIHESQLEVQIDKNLRQIITGSGENDYEDIICDLETEYYALTKDRLPRQRLGGPRSNQLIELKLQELQEIGAKMQKAVAFFEDQQRNQQALEDSEKERIELDYKISSLKRMAADLNKLQWLEEQISRHQEKKDSILEQLEKAEQLNYKKASMESQINDLYPHLLKFDPFDLEREVSAYLSLRSAREEKSAQYEKLSQEKSMLENDSRLLPDFAEAPENLLFILENREKLTSEINAAQHHAGELREDLFALSRKSRKRIWLAGSLIGLSFLSGLIMYYTNFLPLTLLFACTVILVGGISFFLAEVIRRRKPFRNKKTEQKETLLLIEQLESAREKQNALLGEFKNASPHHLEESYSRYRKNQEEMRDLKVRQKTIMNDLEKYDADPLLGRYYSRYEELVKQKGSEISDEISRYRRQKNQVEIYESQLKAFPALEKLLAEREGCIQAISEFEFEKKQLYVENPALKKLTGKIGLDQMIGKTETEIQKAWDNKNQIEGRIAKYRERLRQNYLDTYNPEKLKEQQNQLIDDLKHLESRKQALMVAIETLQSSINEYRNLHLETLNADIREYWENTTQGKHFAINVDEDFHLNLFYKGLEVKTGQLSSGTRDQLFLAYRIVLGKLIAPRSKFPFIIDDAFVHFDRERTKRIFKILNNLKKEHQIIICSSNSDYQDWCDYIIQLDKLTS